MLMEREPWHENLKKLVYSTPPEAILAPWLLRTTWFPEREQYPMVPTGKVTLLGDAAHAMSNERALGGNNVLEDARVLSALLSNASKQTHWRHVIEQYEKEMFARTKIAVHESENAAEYFRGLR